MNTTQNKSATDTPSAARQILEQATATSSVVVCFVVALLGIILLAIGCASGGLAVFSDPPMPKMTLFVILGAVQLVVFLPYAVILVLVRSLLRVIDDAKKGDHAA